MQLTRLTARIVVRVKLYEKKLHISLTIYHRIQLNNFSRYHIRFLSATVIATFELDLRQSEDNGWDKTQSGWWHRKYPQEIPTLNSRSNETPCLAYRISSEHQILACLDKWQAQKQTENSTKHRIIAKQNRTQRNTIHRTQYGFLPTIRMELPRRQSRLPKQRDRNRTTNVRREIKLMRLFNGCIRIPQIRG